MQHTRSTGAAEAPQNSLVTLNWSASQNPVNTKASQTSVNT
jgi:hypothetical protein